MTRCADWALSYFFVHREKILREIREDEEFVRQMRERTGPGPLASLFAQAIQ